MATAVNVSATNNAEIDGLLSGIKWSGTITYSFPDSPSDYANPYSGGDGEPTTSGFASAPTQIQAAVNYAIGLILSYTNANVQYAGTNGADIMIAQSPAANPTAYAYYPGNYAPGGDIWFGTQYSFSLAKLGNYYFTTALHELGHAFGLKHSQEAGGPANVAVPSAHDDSEYTVMSYRSYVGASTTGGYTNEAYGYSQTYMANDILALQTMYGADYTTQSSNTVYSWDPMTGQEFINGVGQLAPGGGVAGSPNRIYETVWDGGGFDTYDLSNYTINLSINLNPGASSVFSAVQLAYLGNGHYASGNVYNAYLFDGDARSYIDNANGGSANDSIIGNAIANTLNGGGGNDTITGGGGNDTIIGGAGTDTAVYSGSRANYGISYDTTTQVFTLVDQRYGELNGSDIVSGTEYFQFADGTISSITLIGQLTPVVIETIGDTSLVQVGSTYELNPAAGGTGPSLKYQGATVGSIAPWIPIAAERTSTGYDVAWKDPTSGQFSIWTTNSNGNHTSFLTGAVSGTSTTLQNIENTFHQDLNGDGTIGMPAAPSAESLESVGSTSLTKVGSNYALYANGTSVGPVLKMGGTAVFVGQAGTWSPIAAEQTSTGYDVAWKDSSTGQFSIWTTDSNGNFTSFLTGAVSGTSTTLRSVEDIFHQDLNGDGTIGILTLVIESAGVTSLVASGTNYLLSTGGTGPLLKMSGSLVSVGQAGTWSPIAAEQVSVGYEVAWKDSSTGQFSIWGTDSNGNFTAFLTGAVAGNSSTFQSYEAIFHQDLNGDGFTGVHSASLAPSGRAVTVTSDGFVFAEFGTGLDAPAEQPNSMPEPASSGADVHEHDAGVSATFSDYLIGLLHDHQLLA
ncbi:matrixin family metalloprotease [Bradyrhizobium sp. DOA1]|uniref:M10 family metallopeptidase C-terminal domain-containing protein n=1 Tax=Bradyrhizobium sp. DOA1 TaxID=1126616 RepID=UPI0009EE787E|nr:matrixin family metalloprotease [Bradyrhizobium sp. DOA1]